MGTWEEEERKPKDECDRMYYMHVWKILKSKLACKKKIDGAFTLKLVSSSKDWL